ncbi:MAG: hypothetical protein H6599_03780 [Flavobacteriales bacterium]|nr:hypothetical protein [Flavobacteriales bacterium]
MNGIILVYSEVFSGAIPKVEELVSKIPSKMLLEILSNWSGDLHIDSVNPKVQREILRLLLRRQPELIKFHMFRKMYVSGQTIKAALVDVYTVLEMINIILSNPNKLEAKDTTPEDELSILKAFLVINENMYNRGIDSELARRDKFEFFKKHTWPLYVASTELRLRNNVINDVYRGLMFSSYLETNKVAKELFQELFKPKEPHIHILPVSVFQLYQEAGYRKDKNTMFGWFKTNLEEDVPFIKPWILDFSSYDPAAYIMQDFRTLRSFPIIKVREESYCVVNWNFILNKLYTGLIFDLYEKTGISEPKSAFYKPKLAKFTTFKGDIGGTFSEEFCGELLKNALPTHVFKSGKPDTRQNQDFYIRKGRQIALIEHKDALFKKDDDYDRILETLEKKLVRDQGVSQLIKLIQKLQEDITVFEPSIDEEVNCERLVLHPILLVTDTTFAMPGMEDYVNTRFKEELKKLGSLRFYVHRLVILDVDVLMKMHDPLVLNKRSFFKILNRYYLSKLKMRKRARKKYATVNEIMAQHKGTTELIGNFLKQIHPKKRIPGTLKDNMIKELRRHGF